MASTYSNIKIQLMTTGENATTWGNVTNVNLGTALEEAIVGSADVAFSNANVTLTLTDTNATQTARNMRLNLTGTATSGYNLIVPAIKKPYIVNNATDGTITVKNATGTGIAVPSGKTMWVYNNGTNVVDAVTAVTSLSIAGALTLSTALPVASGGTGANTLTSGYLVKGNGTSAVTASVVYDNGTNVGIGTTTPGSLLHLSGAAAGSAVQETITNTDATGFTGFAFTDGTNTKGQIWIGNGSYASFGGAGSINYSANSGPHVWYTNYFERMRISAAGGVSIGTTTDAGTTNLLVAGSVSAASASFTTALPTASGGTGSNATTYCNLQANVTGILPITKGGTGANTAPSALTALGAAASGANTDITSLNSSTTINGVVIGYRNIPRSTTSGTATTGDVGKVIAVSAGITIPNSTFAAGDAVSIYNDSASSITITAGVTTLRQAGTTNTGNRTLAARGMATIWFNSSTEAIISGAGVS